MSRYTEIKHINRLNPHMERLEEADNEPSLWPSCLICFAPVYDTPDCPCDIFSNKELAFMEDVTDYTVF